MDTEKIFESRKIFLKITGFWPEECERAPFYSHLKMGLCLVSIISLIILQIMGIIMVASADKTPENDVLRLISETKEFDKRLQETIEEQKISQFWQSCQEKLTTYLVRIYSILMLLFLAVVLFLTDKVLPLKLIFKPNTIYSPWYEVLYIVETLTLGIVLCALISSDIYFVTFICQICKEFRLIKLLLDSLKEDESKNLLRIMKRHVTILRYGEEVCKILSVAFFSQHSLICLALCCTSFTILTVQNSAKVNQMIGIFVVSMFLLLVICIAGEIVTMVTEDIASAVMRSNMICYNGKHDNLNNLRNITFMLLRAQKPLRLSVGTFGMINLQFFSATMKMTYSSITLLRTMYV